MSDAAEWFRARLSERLRAALTDRDRRAIRTLRCVMSAIDNAGAVPKEEGVRLSASSTNEVLRRRLSEREIAEILQAEIDARSRAVDEYERVGDAAQAAQLRDEIAAIENMTTLLG